MLYITWSNASWDKCFESSCEFHHRRLNVKHNVRAFLFSPTCNIFRPCCASFYKFMSLCPCCKEEVWANSESLTLVNRKLFNTLPEGILTHLPGHEYPMRSLLMWKLKKKKKGHTPFKLQMRKYLLAFKCRMPIKPSFGSFTFKVNEVVLCPTTMGKCVPFCLISSIHELCVRSFLLGGKYHLKC